MMVCWVATAAMLHNEKADRPKSPNDAMKNDRLSDQGPKTYSNNPAVSESQAASLL